MNEIDRDLLMFAAKAAGVEIYESTDGTIESLGVPPPRRTFLLTQITVSAIIIYLKSTSKNEK